MCSDYDGCKYIVKRNNELNSVYFGFSCYNFKEILEAGEKFFHQKHYSNECIFFSSALNINAILNN